MTSHCLAVSGALMLAVACSPTQEVAQEGAEPVQCALAGEGDWSDACRLETARVAGANIYIVRHPDGSFRRLLQRDDGFVALDGADEARSEVRDGRVIVTVAEDAYSFPNPDAANE